MASTVRQIQPAPLPPGQSVHLGCLSSSGVRSCPIGTMAKCNSVSSCSSNETQTFSLGSSRYNSTINVSSQWSSCEISLAWRNLRYQVRSSLWSANSNKVILRRLNGHVRYRTMTGFMGPSGAGKTTLLNCLNGNIQRLAHGSELYVNRAERKVPVCGFIEQHVHETIIGRLTVQEVLSFAYRFKNTNCTDNQLMQQHIRSTLTELMLDHAVLQRKFQQCSGGEQKRIAVAQELMSRDRKPHFMFIDEPTTGLDSQAAMEVMRCLRQLTLAHGITVLVSIHLPNHEILRMFDQLYILAKGGVAIYAGPPDNLRGNLLKQLSIEIDDSKPPVEEYLKIACHGIEDNRVSRLADQTLVDEHKRLSGQLHELRLLPGAMPRRLKSFCIRDFLLQLYRIFYIVFVVDLRILIYQMLVYSCFLLTISTVFDHRMLRPSMCYSIEQDNGSNTCQQQLDDEAYTDSYIAYQAFCNMFFGVIMLGVGAILFTPMLKMFRHEHRNRWYSMSSFYWPFLLVRLIEVSLFSLVITVLIYFPTEHHQIDNYQINWYRFWHFAFFIWLSCVYMQTFGQLLSLIFLDQLEISIVMGQLWFIQLSLVNGYLINLAHMNMPILFFVSDILATKPISNGLLYSFYGIDRCQPEKEVSIMLIKFNVITDRVYTELLQVFINIFIIRTLTFVLMCLRFSINWQMSTANAPSHKQHSPTVSTLHSIQPIAIDYDSRPISQTDFKKKSGQHQDSYQIDLDHQLKRTKHGKEKQFEQFSRNKIIVAWRSLNLFASSSIKEIRPVRETSKLILKNLNGQFRFGTMNALMGTSGAGKTSLLKVLNGRSKTKLSEETKIYLSRYTPIRICYITQDVSGHLLPGLTAKQSLIYASRLKNSHMEQTQPIEHDKIAKDLLQQLDIGDTENTFVQDCSGGERKRLALALELTALRMPNLICIDEPTSGLDSNSAQVVISCLRRLVHHHNLTIVASIHQPNTEVLMMFDECYVLARGGVAIYSGPPNGISEHLSQMVDPNADRNCNFPIEQLIKYSSFDHTHPFIDKLVKLNDMKTITMDKRLAEETQQVMDGIQLIRPQFSLCSVSILCQRYLLYVKGYLWLSLIIYIAIYLFYGIILRIFFNEKIAYTSGCIDMEDDFNSTCNRSQERLEREMDLASNYRYNFYLNAIFLFIVVLQTSLNFSKESVYFFNEHRNGWYSTGAYYLMKSLYDIAPMVPVIVIYVWIVNIYEPLRPGIYWWLLLLIFISVMAIQGMGHLLALLTNGHFTMLTITNIGVFLFLVILSNFFNPIGRMHYIYQLISNLSICRFLNEATILLQYGFGRCGPREIQATLYVMMLHHEDHFYHCIHMLLFNLIFYRTISLAILIAKSNPLENRRQRAQRIRKYQQHMRPLNSIIPGLSASDQQFCIKQIQI